jgi:glycogen(starch) synthase
MVGRKYGWSTIAASTADVYRTAITEAPGFAAKQAAAVLEHGRPQIVVPDGKLLTI